MSTRQPEPVLLDELYETLQVRLQCSTLTSTHDMLFNPPSCCPSDTAFSCVVHRFPPQDYDEEWAPSAAQRNLMRALCDQLRLDYAIEVMGLTDHAKYSARLEQMILERKAQKSDNPAPTPAQINLLRQLHASQAEIAACTTLQEASALIDRKRDEQRLAGPTPPTDAQLNFLRRLDYKGTPPATVSQASKLIGIMKHRRTVHNKMALAVGRGVSPEKVARMQALLQSFMTTQQDA
jgi:hypothetical protein